MRILVVRTADSPPTFITSFFGAKIANFLREKGFDVTEVTDWFRTTRFGWWFFRNYDLILYLGHGEVDKLLGNIYFGVIAPFLNLSNVFVTKNKVIITYACLSANKLGREAVKYAKAYTGSDYFMYIAFPTEIDYSTYFYEPFREMISSLVNGSTIGEAVRTYKDLAMRNANKLKSMSIHEAQVYGTYLELNAKHYQVLGDDSFTL